MATSDRGIQTVNAKYIKQNLFPFPNKLGGGKLGSSSFAFKWSSIESDPAFQDYKNDWIKVSENENQVVTDPLKDCDTYVQQLNVGTPSTTNELTFAPIVIDNKSFNLNYRTHTNAAQWEEYTLDINEQGEVKIRASTYIGVSYAIVSLQQLIEPNDQDGGCIIRNLPIRIEDTPKTNYRAFMLDTARSFVQKKYILDLIQLMGFQKMNYFEWHINDSQSFPLNIGKYCKMFCEPNTDDPTSQYHNMGGSFDYENNFWYDEDDILSVLKTARNYGITVVPGIDTPGHCASFKYGSKAVTKDLFGSPFQIIDYSQLKFETSSNAPEPIIGYLDITGDGLGVPPADKEAHMDKLVLIMHVLFDEIAKVFEMSEGTYGSEFNLGFDEVSNRIMSNEDYKTYSNKLFDLFFTGFKQNANYTPTSGMSDNQWRNCNISFWIDSTMSLNIDSKGNYDESNGLTLSRFGDRGDNLRLGIWNTWPSVTIDQLNSIVKGVPRISFVNMNSNMYYMDSGFPGANVQGRLWDYTPDNKFSYSRQTYWISAVPEMAPQYGANGLNRGWKIGFGDVYNYNFKYDFTGSSSSVDPPLNTGFAKMPHIVGAGLACWTETVSDARLLGQVGINLVALSEVLWKYNESHAPDNMTHAMYRALYHLRKLALNPYNVLDIEPIYSGENIFRRFPQGADIPLEKQQDLVAGNGNIKQEFIDADANYDKWGITIKDDYKGHVNNNLMWNINPTDYATAEESVRSITQFPLCKRFVFGAATATTNRRLNPWLFGDLNTLMSDPPRTQEVVKYVYGKTRTLFGMPPTRTLRRVVEEEKIGNQDPKLGGSNFAKGYKIPGQNKNLYSVEPSFGFMDQRDVPIKLEDVDITLPHPDHKKYRSGE